MNLCEKLNRDASKTSSRSNTMYPVDYILKLRAHAARMHFLAGNPTLATKVLGTSSFEMIISFSFRTNAFLSLFQVIRTINKKRKLNLE